jgi:hypothetical protein
MRAYCRIASVHELLILTNVRRVLKKCASFNLVCAFFFFFFLFFMLFFFIWFCVFGINNALVAFHTIVLLRRFLFLFLVLVAVFIWRFYPRKRFEAAVPSAARRFSERSIAHAYDYVVVGSGPSACALVARLASKKLPDGAAPTILMLEAGADSRHHGSAKQKKKKEKELVFDTCSLKRMHARPTVGAMC